MTDIDHRQAGRDSLFLMADLRIEAQAGDHRVKVRNLSARGMMAEGTVRVTSGVGVEVSLRNLGWVPGRVAWIQDNRFGIAFLDDIDPRVVRAPAGQGAGEHTPRYLKSSVQPPDPRNLRKL
ncbi:PilZ domain-containing protein [Novosphingobium sp. FSW06-99]|uniref:PilZ domain-containing protein n=1 Tax=Novosphingobium sp. FSW06-99 TaxID=1739113 RepID=UPI00076C8B66|nr:PilZ domain-containing protein [Novosphingobium sp. FSW06-99]KUR79128.1 pilus assembly protein PilZ [Novosphingobium sp. FSW06-99]